ncbi:MAG TPA: hypothetical protein ENJ64_03865, partial [Thiotrichales bacterium]|nr:hypothetical protein [Thiotrichales bacterium]
EFAPPYNSLRFDEAALQGQPVAVQWLGDRLYVLLKRDQQLSVVVFSDLTGVRHYRIHPVAHAAVNDLTEASFVVQYGQIAVSMKDQYLVMQADEAGDYKTVYWQGAPGSRRYDDVFASNGGLFLGGSRGIEQVNVPALALTTALPAAGSAINRGQIIRLQFNQLINTGADELVAAIELFDSDSQPLDAADYSLSAVNTVNDGYIDIQFSDSFSRNGLVRVKIHSTLKALNGRTLLKAVSLDYTVNTADTLKIQAVANTTSGLHYVHADGSEQIVIRGEGFGDNAAALKLSVAGIALAPDDILAVSDNEIRARLPDLLLVYRAASLSVTVKRDALSDTHTGALVVLPRAVIEDISPQRGAPQGGNRVDIFGRGFSRHVEVFFGYENNGAIAGGLLVHSANHISVTAPAGSFGYVDVRVDNRLFSGERSVIAQGYFYAGKETGSVELDRTTPAPVSAIALADQVLYAVTGGSYEAIDRLGQVVGKPSTSIAQLIVADIADPVRPQIVQKQLASLSNPYHLNVVLPPDGFNSIEKAGDELFIAGGNHLYHFDTTLPTEPLLLAELELPAGIRSVNFHDQRLYVSGDFGVMIYQLDGERKLRKVKLISRDFLGGGAVQSIVSARSLFVLVPAASRVIELDLLNDENGIIRQIDLQSGDSEAFEASAMLLLDTDRLLVSTGRRASVRLYRLQDDAANGAENGAVNGAVAELKLAYLLKNGDLYAGQLLLKGQTLYVAAGQGDLQLFDIASWLDGHYRSAIPLKHYFSVTGAVNSFAVGAEAIYAGASFVYVNDEATENPLEPGARIQGL